MGVPHVDPPDPGDAPVVGVVGFVERNSGVVEQCQHGGQLEGRARLGGHADGIVAHPLRQVAPGVASQIDHRKHLARCDLHDDGGPPQGVLLLHLAAQGLVGHILDVGFERGDDVQPVLGFHVLGVGHAAVESPCDALAGGNAVAPRQLFAQDGFDAVVAPVSRAADGAERQFALRVDALVALFEPVCQPHVAVQQRVAAQLLPLGIVHRPGKDGHGRMVAQGVVELARDEFTAPEAVDPAGDAPFAARYERVFAVGDPVAAGVLLAE